MAIVCQLSHRDNLFFFDMSTKGKGKKGFELVTSASWGVVHSRLNYSLGTSHRDNQRQIKDGKLPTQARAVHITASTDQTRRFRLPTRVGLGISIKNFFISNLSGWKSVIGIWVTNNTIQPDFVSSYVYTRKPNLFLTYSPLGPSILGFSMFKL